MAELTEGPYGFAWCALRVERIASIEGRVFLRLRTDAGREVEIFCSRAGRSLRVFGRDGREWLPEQEAADA